MVTTPITDKQMERIRSFISGALKNFGLLLEKSFFRSLVLCRLCRKGCQIRTVRPQSMSPYMWCIYIYTRMITFVLMYTYSTHKCTCIKYAFIIVILSNSLHIKPQRNLPTQLRAHTMSLYMQVCTTHTCTMHLVICTHQIICIHKPTWCIMKMSMTSRTTPEPTATVAGTTIV